MSETFIGELLKAPVSDLYLTILSNHLSWTDLEPFQTLSTNHEENIKQIEMDVYKT